MLKLLVNNLFCSCTFTEIDPSLYVKLVGDQSYTIGVSKPISVAFDIHKSRSILKHYQNKMFRFCS